MGKRPNGSRVVELTSPNYVSPNANYRVAVQRSLRLTGLAKDPEVPSDEVNNEYWHRFHKAIHKSAKCLPRAAKLSPYSKYRLVRPDLLTLPTINQDLAAQLIETVPSRQRQKVVRELVLTLHEILRIRGQEELSLQLNGIDDQVHQQYSATRDGRPDNSFISKPHGSCGPLKQDSYDVFDAFSVMGRRIAAASEFRPINMGVELAVVMLRRGGEVTSPNERHVLNSIITQEDIMPVNVVAGEATLQLVRDYKGRSELIGSYPVSHSIDTASLDATLGLEVA
ncbi:MAG TPA: hypothetical protein VFN31_03505 [Candidatus Saccharimonadales bacterium]|nr:hypothetical protein [Candidatus Saccharimonadales bacterium]